MKTFKIDINKDMIIPIKNSIRHKQYVSPIIKF